MRGEKILLVVALILFSGAIAIAVGNFTGIGPIDIGPINIPVFGPGEIISEEREVSSFNKISLQSFGDLIINQGDQESLRIEAGEKAMENIITKVENNTLVIGQKPGVSWGISEKRKFYVNVKEVNEVEISGSGSVQSSSIKTDDLTLLISGSGDANLNLDVKALKSTISGSGAFNLSGKIEQQELIISGSGDYQAKTLESTEAIIEIPGSGNAVVNVKENLKINISGSGNVSYVGSPKIDQNISGSGRVKQLEE